MNSNQFFFKDVSLLITHYNRSASLERLLKTFKDQGISFKEIIVSDDASNSAHIDYINEIKKHYEFILITSDINKGLGNNLNKGQLAVTTPYTLYIQEDFIPSNDFIIHFKDALKLMEEEPSIDIARFYAYFAYPYLKPYKYNFSKVLYKFWYLDTNKVYSYTDHPHLRRSSFFDRFGKYTEGIKSDKTEYEMCISFIQNRGKALFYNDFKALFEQKNSEQEPSTVTRSNWRQSDNLFISFTRWLYRIVKYNFDIHINTKFKK